MEIISISNHIVRKALNLSLNEMAVLCDIKQMSNNAKYNYTCIKSKEKIAEWLDLSRATVFNILISLEQKGYIERANGGLRLTQFMRDLEMCQEEIGLWIKDGNVTLISKKMKELQTVQNLDPSNNWTHTVQNLDSNSLKIRLEPSKNWTQDIHIDKQLDKHKDILFDFEKFWNLYNKKTGRSICEKLWIKFSDTDRKNILDVVPIYVKKNPDQQYRKDPERFLKHKIWNDEQYKPKQVETIDKYANTRNDLK